MNSSQLGTATFVIGALSISFAACATSSDSTGSAGASSTAAGSGVGGGSAGDIGVAGSGVAGSLVSAGSPGFAGSTGFGGSPGAAGAATGTAGAATGTAGATTGTGGAAAMSCGTLTPAPGDVKCCVATGAGTATDLAIDDLEDKDNVILPLGQRQGYWYKYGTDAAQLPTGTMFLPGPGGHPCSLMPAPPACAGTPLGVLYSSHTSGSLLPATTPTYAGIGFDFNNHFAKSCAYGASAYKGISFWAKGTVPFRAAVAIPGTTPTSSDSGTCVPVGTIGCADNYSITVKPVPDNATWTQFTITFADSAGFTQAGWGVKAPFDPAHILNLQFQFDGLVTATAAAPYDFAVDDIAFVP
jgi:hypothetical protein